VCVSLCTIITRVQQLKTTRVWKLTKNRLTFEQMKKKPAIQNGKMLQGVGLTDNGSTTTCSSRQTEGHNKLYCASCYIAERIGFTSEALVASNIVMKKMENLCWV
jgi:hypothetical protein